jgi:hypothetical protein
MKSFIRFVFAIVLGSSCFGPIGIADEGMFPISELKRLNLQEKGLQLNPEELFNSERVSLLDGICRVNGCTGSFVSSDGLIITNHHCAFDAIQKASTPTNDFLANGFIAKTKQDEVRAVGFTVRITESYADVSDQVLSVVSEGMTFLDRTKAIEKRRKELEQAAEVENKGLRAEVAEMFTGKNYVLFLYTYLKDVRLVFAPPISIGAFGGEADNWEWPRHTGDFSFMRAYTAPDGSAAEYSADNIPFHPKRPIQVSSAGANEEDFVFILGYPGRTVRQKTASFFRFEESVRLPAIVELYAWQISEMEKAGVSNREVAIKHASRSKSLANVEKRSRGQLLGLKRTGMVAMREANESMLQTFIAADDKRQAMFGTLLKDIESVYLEMTEKAPVEIHLKELKNACRALSFAFILLDAATERDKEDLEREAPYMQRNYDLTVQQLKLDVSDWDKQTDTKMLLGMLERLMKIPAAKDIPGLRFLFKESLSAERIAVRLLDSTQLGKPGFINECLKKTPEQLMKVDDPLLKLMVQLYPTYKQLRDIDKEREGRLGQLYGSLVEMKQAFQPSDFIPDANATLRITYGRVRGYSPADAVYRLPISTLAGVMEKTTGKEPYVSPQALIAKYQAKDFGPFVHPRLGQVPVAILYNTDTTGGNSGSPVFNSQGELVAVNFDRTFEATINDFAWNADYSRSIGVDVRYVLWVTGWVYDAKHLLDEMGVKF